MKEETEMSEIAAEIQQLRERLRACGIVGQHLGEDVVFRSSVLDLFERSADRLSAMQAGGGELDWVEQTKFTLWLNPDEPDAGELALFCGFSCADKNGMQASFHAVDAEGNTIVLTQAPTPPASSGAPVGNDEELPGMWSHTDFIGGDSDERSHAERYRASVQKWQEVWDLLRYAERQWAEWKSDDAETGDAYCAHTARVHEHYVAALRQMLMGEKGNARG